MAVYLGLVGDSLYPRHLGTEEDGGVCGICHERPAAWGDWMCSRCRAEFEAELRVEMSGEDERVDSRDGQDSLMNGTNERNQ